ncbi:MAG: SMC-Scp complex subunit ScpB, partial [Erysipelotrichaceae bacterium]|nr:SMC-Scp complex subunit ScpB [Erysipelotrichaceae bacterium]
MLVDESQAKAILEGLLFIVGDEGITLEDAATILDVSIEKTEEVLDELQKEYLEDSHGIEVVC